jgi:Flp pilus assembly protein TadG
VIFQFKNRFWKCSAGAVAVTTALVLPVLLGMASLGVEVGHWYLGQREMQGAADAAAISAAAEYIANIHSTSYQTVGASYASYNGFTIPTSNICLVTTNGDNCDTVRSLDSRAIICPTSTNDSGGTTTTWACVVAEITQNTATWLTTRASLEPGTAGQVVKAIPTPTLKARAVVAIKVTTTPPKTTAGNDCILALANSTSAIQVSGSKADLKGDCGIAADGGIDQMVSGTPVGGITFNGSGAKINVTGLDIAGPQSSSACTNNLATTDAAHCQQYGSSAALTAVRLNQPTLDPYTAALNFTNPLGVRTVTIAAAGSGYPKNGTCSFTVSGGSYSVTGTPSPATFTATTDKNGKISSVTVTDPGAYAVFPPSNAVTVTTTNCAAGSGERSI